MEVSFLFLSLESFRFPSPFLSFSVNNCDCSFLVLGLPPPTPIILFVCYSCRARDECVGCSISSSIPPVQHYDVDLLSIHSSTIGLHLSSGDEHQQEMDRSAGSAATAGDVVIVVNATDNEEEEEEGDARDGAVASSTALQPVVNEGCRQLVVNIDTDPDYLVDSPKRGYRSDSSGEKAGVLLLVKLQKLLAA